MDDLVERTESEDDRILKVDLVNALKEVGRPRSWGETLSELKRCGYEYRKNLRGKPRWAAGADSKTVRGVLIKCRWRTQDVLSDPV